MILCDTGPLVAACNAADRDHGRCAGFLRENWSRLVVPSLAVTEVCGELSTQLFQLAVDPRQLGPRMLFPQLGLAMQVPGEILDLAAEQPQPRVPAHPSRTAPG